eukprot:scaffold4132_cov28-Tisochrysis_lutea.AAC.1
MSASSGQVIGGFHSYYGAMLCCCFSHDGSHDSSYLWHMLENACWCVLVRLYITMSCVLLMKSGMEVPASRESSWHNVGCMSHKQYQRRQEVVQAS